MSDKSGEEAEETEAQICDGFEKATDYIKKAQAILEDEAHRVRKEREALESFAKRLEHVHFSSTIKLNVGGQLFNTSLQTLTKDEGSMLHAMFSGRFDTKPAEDGSYFIDRDGTYFRHILNYLRTGKLLLPDDKLVHKEVMEEAKFYQIQGIIDKLKPKPYIESEILSQEQCKWLSEVVGKPYDVYNLKYRATKDGWSSTNFHNLCDKKGPTLVVVKSGNNIFGGYTEETWDCSNTYKRDDAAFLFSLVNPSGEPTKMEVKPDMTNAIFCNSSFGPTFGGGRDLYIVNNPYSANCSTTLGSTYNCPPGKSGTTFLTGNQNFIVTEIEVFEHVMIG